MEDKKIVLQIKIIHESKRAPLIAKTVHSSAREEIITMGLRVNKKTKRKRWEKISQKITPIQGVRQVRVR